MLRRATRAVAPRPVLGTVASHSIRRATGGELGRVYSGPGAHGLTYFPNAGRYSIGHNGVYR